MTESRTRSRKAIGRAVSAAALLLMLIAASVGQAAAPTRLVSVKRFADTRDPTNVNGTLFFGADDGIHGTELWKSDGTRRWGNGTALVKDITPGPSSTYVSDLTAVNDILFFPASGQLWKSDGTAEGTIPLADVYPTELTNVNGTLFFRADDGIHGSELWKSDGTAAGTSLIKAISPIGMINVNGEVFFAANDGSHGYELWKSDGTAAGTVLVKDINPGPGDSTYGYGYLAADNLQGTLLFSASDGTHGDELWKSDGTAEGTTLVKDIKPGPDDSYPSNLTNVNATLFFSANSGAPGTGLWKSDGTAAGTSLVKDMSQQGGVGEPTNVNGELFFRANGLWKSDGTAAGTLAVRDPGPFGIGSYPYSLTNVNGTLFFGARGEPYPMGELDHWHLWKSDGTAAGTVLVSGVVNLLEPQYFGYLEGEPMMAAVDGTLFLTRPGLYRTKPRIHHGH